MFCKNGRKIAGLFVSIALISCGIFSTVSVQAANISLQNPQIVPDSSMTAGQKVTWDCVWFGSYPQAEVVSSEMNENYTALDKTIISNGDLLVSDNVYSALQSASGWDSNGDIILNGIKYRRMKKEDATFQSDSSLFDSSSFYAWSAVDKYHYFKYEPVKWRVISINGSQALLLADIALDDQTYNLNNTVVTWEIGSIRSWLNGYGASANEPGKDYSKNNFIDSAFTASEQSAIVNTTVQNDDNIIYGTDGGNNTTDKIFLLAESEVYSTDTAVSYGFVKNNTEDEARRCKSSTFAKAMGVRFNTSSTYMGNCAWRLRSPGSDADVVSCVGLGGFVNYLGNDVNIDHVGVRPALNLNLSSALYSYAGTVCSDGTMNEVEYCSAVDNGSSQDQNYDINGNSGINGSNGMNSGEGGSAVNKSSGKKDSGYSGIFVYENL